MFLKKLILLFLIFNLSSSEITNKNTLLFTPLFSQENFGRIRRIFYQNEKQKSNLLFLSDDSVSSANLSNRNINFRKKLNKNCEIINLDKKNFFVAEPKSSSVQVYRTETGQLINSLELINENDLMLKIETVKVNEVTMTVFLSFKSLQIQSKKKIIFERNFEFKKSNDKKDALKSRFIDLFVDKEGEQILYCFVDDGQLKVFSIKFDALYQNILSRQREEDDSEDEDESKTKKKKEEKPVLENQIFDKNIKNVMIIKGLLTKEFLYAYDGKNVFGYNVIKGNMEMFDIPEKYLSHQMWSFFKENSFILRGQKNFYYFNNGQITSQFEAQKHTVCSLSNSPTQKLFCYLDDSTSDKNLVSYFVDSQGKLDRKHYVIDSLVKIYSNSNTIDEVKLIETSPFNDNIFTIVTTNKIMEFNIKDDKVELIGEMENNYEKYVSSNIFIYNNDENDSENAEGNLMHYYKYYTTINSMKTNLNLLKIITNIGRIIIDDLIEIINSLKKLFINLKVMVDKLLNKNLTSNLNEDKNKDKIGVLFLVTKNNLLKILDLYTGKVLYLQQFPKHQMLKILKDDNSTSQRYVSILLGKKNFFVFDIKENKFVNDISSIYPQISQNDNLLLNEEQLSVIISSYFENINKKPVFDLKKYQLNEKLFGAKKEKNAVYIDYEKGILYILKFYINQNGEQKLTILNNYEFGNIISVSNPKISENTSQHYLSEGKIFYKFIDGDIYYILSIDKDEAKEEEKDSKQKNKNKLILTILNGKTGKILSEQIVNNIVPSSVNYLFEENWGLISFIKLNKGFKRNEILSFEIMNKNVDYNLMRLIKNKLNKNISSNKENEIEILVKTYVTERKIKNISISKSKYNKSNKYILFILDNNDLQLINRDALSPRRPNMIQQKGKSVFDPDNNSIYVDKEFPGYTPIITFDNNLRFINSDKIDIYDIKTMQGETESNFITCLIGENVDCKIMYPDKLYDRLSHDFKKELLLAVCLGFIGFIYFFRKYYQKTELKKILVGN